MAEAANTEAGFKRVSKLPHGKLGPTSLIDVAVAASVCGRARWEQSLFAGERLSASFRSSNQNLSGSPAAR